jgi:hypothetical protein
MNLILVDKLAQQAGIPFRPPMDSLCSPESLLHFASLVAAAEREACALTCEQAGIDGYGTLAAAQLIRKR